MGENAFKELNHGYALVVFSGGMDSTTLVYHCLESYEKVELVSVDYGQRHVRELEHAGRTAQRFGLRWDTINIQAFGAMLSGSALLGDADVPEGHYEEETMQITVVPNRNSIMLNLVAGIAISRGAGVIATGVHAGDHAVYPDCRPEFINALNKCLHEATAQDIHVSAPFVFESKADIAKRGQELGVMWSDTWSCYKGARIHCGRCSTCIERIEAFHVAGVSDPTEYADASLYLELRDAGRVE